jgi:hypothetical protein
MNLRSISACAPVAALFVVLSWGANIHAAAASAENRTLEAIEQENQLQPMAVDRRTEAALLQQAYQTLAVADHDYKGHRVRAMKHIEAAAKHLGVNLQGDGKVREKQAISDAQLREAQSQLQQVSVILAGNKQPRVVKQVDAAIKEISIALTIR